MAYEIYIPKLGANMTEGRIESWYIDEGDNVDIGEPLFELVTDKATVDVEAESRGMLRKILAPAGTTVPIVTTVGIIAGMDEDISQLLEEIEQRKAEDSETDVRLAFQKPLSPLVLEKPSFEPSPPSEKQIPAGKIKASPKARKIAGDLGVDLSRVTPSNGIVITCEDVLKFSGEKKSGRKIVIIGAGEYSRVILEIINLAGEYIPAGFIDDNESIHGDEIMGVKILGGTGLLSGLKKQGIEYFIVTVGVPRIRAMLFQKALNAGLSPASAIHPRACISHPSRIEPGCVVEAFSVVAINCIVEQGVFITQNCSVSHDCLLGRFSHLAPGSHMGGRVTVGQGTLIGVGASVAPHLAIGDNVIITPGTSIDNSIPAGSVVEGVPGRIIGKTRFDVVGT